MSSPSESSTPTLASRPKRGEHKSTKALENEEEKRRQSAASSTRRASSASVASKTQSKRRTPVSPTPDLITPTPEREQQRDIILSGMTRTSIRTATVKNRSMKAVVPVTSKRTSTAAKLEPQKQYQKNKKSKVEKKSWPPEWPGHDNIRVSRYKSMYDLRWCGRCGVRRRADRNGDSTEYNREFYESEAAPIVHVGCWEPSERMASSDSSERLSLSVGDAEVARSQAAFAERLKRVEEEKEQLEKESKGEKKAREEKEKEMLDWMDSQYDKQNQKYQHGVKYGQETFDLDMRPSAMVAVEASRKPGTKYFAPYEYVPSPAIATKRQIEGDLLKIALGIHEQEQKQQHLVARTATAE